MDRNEVSTSFEIVLEEIEVVVDSLNQDGSEAFKKGDYDSAQKLIEIATRITDYRNKVRELQKEWDALFSAKVPVRLRKPRKDLGRLQRGLRTPQEIFRKPLLETLIEQGGSAPVKTVLEILGKKLKHIINEYDKQPLPSNPNTTRWENNAQWCRNTMVHQEGLMKDDSPGGIWEISDKGREALKRGEV